MAIIKELQSKIETEKENKLDDKMLEFINKGGGSITTPNTNNEKKKINNSYHRLTLRIPTRLMNKINTKRLEGDCPATINHWIIRQIQRIID